MGVVDPSGLVNSSLLDPLRDSNFYLFDVAPIDRISLPIFIPLFGFQSISSPELTIETTEVAQANDPYPTHVVKSASVGSITLTRGVTFIDADFWRWITSAISGSTGVDSDGGLFSREVGGLTYRRTLLLIHFFRNFPAESTAARVASAVVAGGAVSAVAGVEEGSGWTGAVAAAQLAALGVWQGVFGTEWDAVSIPARAFLLKDCIPTRYKMGSDFDANSGQISVAELDVQPHYVEEISLFA